MYAAYKGHFDCAKVLLEAGADCFLEDMVRCPQPRVPWYLF